MTFDSPRLRRSVALSFFTVGCCLLSASRNAPAADFQTLHYFSAPSGINPAGGVVGIGGTLYGTALVNGPAGDGGVVYSLGLDGANYGVVHPFSGADGTLPLGELINDGSTIFGTTFLGGSRGNGTLYSVKTTGADFQLLHSFPAFVPAIDGFDPSAGVVRIGTGLYGITQRGGASDLGAAFSVNTDGSNYQLIHSFAGADGRYPQAPLIAVGSKLYGVAGTVFSMDLDGSNFNVLHTFTGGADGSSTFAGLTLFGGRLFGTTSGGGAHNAGTMFSLNTDGSDFQTLYAFDFDSDNTRVSSLTPVGASFYGTQQGSGASDPGSVFRIGTDGSNFHTVHAFQGADGANPQAGVTLIGSKLYGTTRYGGISGAGTVFSLAVPEPSALTLTLVGLFGAFATRAFGWRLMALKSNSKQRPIHAHRPS